MENKKNYRGYIFEITLKNEKYTGSLYLSTLCLDDNKIVFEDTKDYYHGDEDSYWEDYYTIKEDLYEKIINRIKNKYKPFEYNYLPEVIKNEYLKLKSENQKLLLLYILAINNESIYNFEITEKENGKEGAIIIEILCGNEIKCDYSNYSKGG